METQSSTKPIVSVVGAGSIGTSWAIAFTIAGYFVRLHDNDNKRLQLAREEVLDRVTDLKAFDLIDESPDQVIDRLSTEMDIEIAITGAEHIQECIPETIDKKIQIFCLLARLTPSDVVIASSSSFLSASKFCTEVRNPERCLVIHPGNPPYLLRIAEVVPASFTSASVVQRAIDLMENIGIRPVIVRKEIDGFIFNRLQGALLTEAYALVEDGIASSEEIDAIVRDGLGFRWSVTGPFETVDLNTRGGIGVHAQKMGPAYQRITGQRGTNYAWSPQVVSQVETERREILPIEQWSERVRWRDRTLMALSSARKMP